MPLFSDPDDRVEIPLGTKKPTFIPSLCWSSDSRDILFSVGTRENSAVWRVPASGAFAPRPVQLLGDGAAGQAARLQRMPVSGGESIEVLSGLARGQHFVVTASGIWYMTPNTSEGSLIQFYDFASKSTHTVYRTSRATHSGLSLCPDHKRILFSQIERPQGHDLFLLEPFK